MRGGGLETGAVESLEGQALISSEAQECASCTDFYSTCRPDLITPALTPPSATVCQLQLTASSLQLTGPPVGCAVCAWSLVLVCRRETNLLCVSQSVFHIAFIRTGQSMLISVAYFSSERRKRLSC